MLHIIGASPGALTPVFQAIVKSAVELCGARFGAVFKMGGDLLHLAAHNFKATQRQLLEAQYPMRPNRGHVSGRAILTRSVVQIPDINVDEDYRGAEAKQSGFRSLLATPLLKSGRAMGSIVIYKAEAGTFTARQLALLQNFAAQAVIAIENARLFTETEEALERQIATADILKVIASSPSDVQPVFEAIAESAKRLLGGIGGLVTRVVDDELRAVAITAGTTAGTKAILGLFPARLSSSDAHCRAATSGRPIINNDIPNHPNASPKRKAAVAAWGFRSLIVVPMLRDGKAIGTIGVARAEAGEFSTHHIELLKTFADQAVIAIENTRLFNETKETLARQTATADVLNVISRSPTDAAPVFDVIGERAERLCDAEISVVSILDGELIKVAGIRGISRDGVELFRTNFPMPLHRQTVTAQTIRSGTVVHLSDVLADPTYDNKELATQTGYRSCLGVPMHNKGQVIGAIFVARTQPGLFWENQVRLLQIFADQAVIAIQNVKLFEEVQARTRDLQESLQQQTATADVLKVIATSPTKVGPALHAIVESACKFCDAYDANVLLKIGENLHYSAHYGPIRTGRGPDRISRQWVVGRSVVDKVPVQVSNYLTPEVAIEFPEGQRSAIEQGHRCTLSVPLLRDGEAIGAIALRRLEPVAFSARQVALLQTFADQAVIAIGNVRLFEEVQARTRDLSESLQQQTATADVLKVISRSAFDLQTVLETLTRSAVELSGALRGSFSCGTAISSVTGHRPMAISTRNGSGGCKSIP